MKKLTTWLKSAVFQLRMKWCWWRARKIVARVKAKWPNCDGVMANLVTLATGVTADGQQASYIYWGTTGHMAENGSGLNSGYYIVESIEQEEVVAFRNDLTNGDGLTSTRVIGVDGSRWRVTVRSDDRQNAFPKIGTQVYLKDRAKFVSGSTGGLYASRVVESSASASPRSPHTRSITTERFVLID